jgi:hypothetical protein
VGTVQLDLAMPPNQQHRAEVVRSLTPALEPATIMYKELG